MRAFIVSMNVPVFICLERRQVYFDISAYTVIDSDRNLQTCACFDRFSIVLLLTISIKYQTL